MGFGEGIVSGRRPLAPFPNIFSLPPQGLLEGGDEIADLQEQLIHSFLLHLRHPGDDGAAHHHPIHVGGQVRHLFRGGDAEAHGQGAFHQGAHFGERGHQVRGSSRRAPVIPVTET